jgi:UDP-glucose 4-epimerase
MDFRDFQFMTDAISTHSKCLKQRLLITGASGFVGLKLVKLLACRDYYVSAFSRKNLEVDGQVDNTILNISKNTAWALHLKDITTVIHLAGRAHKLKDKTLDSMTEFRENNVEATINLAKQSIESGVKRFIFISSAAVYGEMNDAPYKSTDEFRPRANFAKAKVEAEQALLLLFRDQSAELVIIRPPLVYGKDAPGNFALLVKLVQSRVPLPFGLINNKRSMISIDNLVDFIGHCIGHPNAANASFLVSDNHDVSIGELLRTIAGARGIRILLVPVPKFLVYTIFTVFGQKKVFSKVCTDCALDINDTMTKLEWNPPYKFEESIKKCFVGE